MTIEDFAKQQNYDKVSFVCNYKSRKVYELSFSWIQEDAVVGFPTYAVEKDKSFEIVKDQDKIFDIMEIAYPDEE